MVEDLAIEHRAVRQLFGDGARIDGRMGSGIAPGCIEIKVDGRRLGCGLTFRQALEYATRKASALATNTRAGVA